MYLHFPKHGPIRNIQPGDLVVIPEDPAALLTFYIRCYTSFVRCHAYVTLHMFSVRCSMFFVRYYARFMYVAYVSI